MWLIALFTFIGSGLFCFLLDWIWLLGAMIVLGSGYCVFCMFGFDLVICGYAV